MELRRSELGYVFQGFGLIPVLSAAENVEVPLRIRRTGPERAARVAEMLELVGLAGHAEQRPGELSGGQQQRVGLARALAARPTILLADEPTGQLDSGTAASMMDLMSELVHSEGIAAVVSTHDPMLMSAPTASSRSTTAGSASARTGGTRAGGAGVTRLRYRRGSALHGAAEAGAAQEHPLEDQEQRDRDDASRSRAPRGTRRARSATGSPAAAPRAAARAGSGSTSIGQR